MVVEESDSPQESSTPQKIMYALGTLELKRSELAIVLLQIRKKAGTSVDVLEVVSTDSGLNVEDREAIEIDSRNENMR